MTKEQLRDKYEQENGIRCITPKGDGDIRYVEWLEDQLQEEIHYAEPDATMVDIKVKKSRANPGRGTSPEKKSFLG